MHAGYWTTPTRMTQMQGCLNNKPNRDFSHAAIVSLPFTIHLSISNKEYSLLGYANSRTREQTKVPCSLPFLAAAPKLVSTRYAAPTTLCLWAGPRSSPPPFQLDVTQ